MLDLTNPIPTFTKRSHGSVNITSALDHVWTAPTSGIAMCQSVVVATTRKGAVHHIKSGHKVNR